MLDVLAKAWLEIFAGKWSQLPQLPGKVSEAMDSSEDTGDMDRNLLLERYRLRNELRSVRSRNTALSLK